LVARREKSEDWFIDSVNVLIDVNREIIYSVFFCLWELNRSRKRELS
jgi:hypothetical protein